jgi:cytochrome P450
MYFRLFDDPTSQTAAALAVFMLAMALYPDVMHKAQAEIDTVVSRHRMPTFADRPHLPYVRAIVKEVLRWRPVGPLGELTLLTKIAHTHMLSPCLPRGLPRCT